MDGDAGERVGFARVARRRVRDDHSDIALG